MTAPKQRDYEDDYTPGELAQAKRDFEEHQRQAFLRRPNPLQKYVETWCGLTRTEQEHFIERMASNPAVLSTLEDYTAMVSSAINGLAGLREVLLQQIRSEDSNVVGLNTTKGEQDR